MNNWQEIILGESLYFNPKEQLAKGKIYKKISMDCLSSKTRQIERYETDVFNGGSKFRNGDTLFARITPCLENGKTSQVSILGKNEIAFGSTEFIVLREKENITLNNFIYYLFTSKYIKDIAIKSMSGTSGRQRVQEDILKNLKIKLPPLPTQKRITDILSSLDNKIELNNKINKTLENIAEALFKEWFINFNFPNREGKPYKDSGGKMTESELGDIPEGWRIESFDNVANFLNGLPMQKFRNTNDNFLYVLKIKELRQGFVDENSDKARIDIDKKYIIENGDVIFSWSASLMTDIWTGGKVGLNQHLFKVTSNKFNKWFYYLWIKKHMANFIAIANDKTTTMGHIKREHLTKAQVLIPSDSQLKQFDNVFSNLLSQITNLRLENQKLVGIRDSLLPKLMSGEIKT